MAGMANKYLMTWLPKTKRWKKRHRGRDYFVSCRQLETAPTKEASWRAANQWWLDQAKEAEQPTEGDRIARATAISRLAGDFRGMDDDERRSAVDSILGEGSYQKLLSRHVSASTATETVPIERTVKAQVDAWLALLHSSSKAGQLSGSRFDSYQREIGKFVAWIEPATSIDAVDEPKLESFFVHLSDKVSDGEYSKATASLVFLTARQFISRLAEMKLITAPGNLRSRRFRFGQGLAATIETFTVGEVRGLLSACDGFSDRTKLFILLMLNTGATQGDVADLRRDEVDWNAGLIKRARSKTRDRGGPTVTYKLWDETFALLKEHRAESGELALTTREGNPLVRRWVEGGKMRKYDLIRTAWANLAKRMGVRNHRLGMKHLRKTAATILAGHPQFKYYGPHFLAHAPQGVADRHYIRPADPEFFAALDWLRGEILGPEGG